MRTLTQAKRPTALMAPAIQRTIFQPTRTVPPQADHILSIQAQFDNAQRFGHSFSHVSIFPPTGSQMQDFSDGHPLPKAVQQNMEMDFGHDFSKVRIHEGPQAPSVGAIAYTRGTDIYFAPGTYQPGITSGQTLLKHELTHVVQQREGRVRPTIQAMGMLINNDPALENEADAMARYVPQIMPSYAIHQRKMQASVPNSFNTVVSRGITESSAVIQMNGLSTGVKIGGVTLGLVGAALITGGALPISAGVAATYAGLGILGGLLGQQAGEYLEHRDLKGEKKLEDLQKNYGGNSQGTLVFVQAGGKYYMIEQQTNNQISAEAGRRGISYIPQTRVKGYHAEMRFVGYAKENNISLSGSQMWVSKPICKDCKDVLVNEGVTIKTSTNNIQYHGWVSPYEEGYARVLNPTGVLRGRRSELELLKD